MKFKTTFRRMEKTSVYLVLLMLLCVGVQNAHAQEVLYDISGRSFFPDSSVLKSNGITKIYRKKRDYLITWRDTTEFAPIYDEYYFINEDGDIDSTTIWSSNDDDSLFCISRDVQVINADRTWKEYHSYDYYCTFINWSEGRNWLPCYREIHSYKAVANNVLSPSFDTNIRQKIISDTTRTSMFINALRFHENDRLIKDSLLYIDVFGVESKVVRSYSYNENNQLISVVEETTSKEGIVVTSEVRYEFDNAGNRIRKIEYNADNPNGKTLREYDYNKKGQLIYEEVEEREIGVKSRAYYYDSEGRVKKIKERHFKGGKYSYFITYDERGFLKQIVDQNCRGQFKTVTTFTYSDF